MKLPWPFNGRSTRPEHQMTDEDWTARALEQAMAMREGGTWEDANIGEDGVPSAGDYNGDYTDDIHDQQNARLSDDPNFAAQTARDLNLLYRGEQNRRNRRNP